MFNFAIFSYLKMGGETLKQLTIQVSRACPPGSAWLRRFKQKFRLACLVGTSHCPLVSVSWSGLTGLHWRRGGAGSRRLTDVSHFALTYRLIHQSKTIWEVLQSLSSMPWRSK